MWRVESGKFFSFVFSNSFGVQGATIFMLQMLRRRGKREGGEGEKEERAKRRREKLGLSFHFVVLLSGICLSNVLKSKGESPTVEVGRQNFRLRRQRPENKAKKDIDKGLAGKNQRRRRKKFGPF